MANLFPYVGPAFLVAVGFMDPGSWATVIEGGSRFGFELTWAVLFSTLLAMLLQSISGRLGIITGKHLAQVCREEYPWAVCALLWVLCEISIITLDLTMVLATAIGLNIVLRMPILPSLFLMSADSLLFIFILPLMERKTAEVITMGVVGIVPLCFLLESISRSPLSITMVAGLLPKLRHETLYTTISIVGTSVMPHNLYLHSALAKGQEQGNQSLSTLSNYNFLGTFVAFSAVLVVNLAVLVVSVTGFHNAGLVVLTLQDAQTLIEQILNNSVSPAVLGLALLCAGQLSNMNASTAGQVVSETFLDCKVRPWQHRLWIRGIALVPAATCVWRYGNEGTYQMLVFSQVLLALHLPFTVAPLIKITSSERIMGSHKNSFLLEILAWLSVSFISAVNVTLVFDLAFGESEEGVGLTGVEYLSGYEWLTEMLGENLQTVVFAIISLGTSLSLGFLVWLVFTPLQLDTQLSARPSWMEDYAKQEEADLTQQALATRHALCEACVEPLLPQMIVGRKVSEEIVVDDISSISCPEKETKVLQLKATAEICSDKLLNIQEVPQTLCLDSCEDHLSQDPISSPSSSSAIGSPFATSPPDATTSWSSMRKPVTKNEVPTVEDREAIALKRAEAEADADAELLGKDDDEMDGWEGLEQDDILVDALMSKVNGSSTSSLRFEGPESGRSGRSDTSVGSEGESGSGSLSRLSGLGRAARRQFAIILDEFWGNIFDLHGQPLLSRLHGVLPGPVDCHMDLLGSSSFHGASDGRKSHSKEPKLSWKKLNSTADQIHNMEAYMLRAHTHTGASISPHVLASESHKHEVPQTYMSERRYSSMRMPSYHEDYDYQPATIHGYRTPSFPGRKGSFSANYKARPLHLEMPHFGAGTAPDHSRQKISNSSAKREDRDPLVDHGQPLLSSRWASITGVERSATDTNGADRLLTQTEKHLGASETSSYDSSQWDPILNQSRSSTLGRWNPLVYRATGELDMNSVWKSQELTHRPSFTQSPIGRGGEGDHVERAPLVFDELSPSQSHRDGFSIQTSTSRSETQSLWSRQPFEQLFGASNPAGLTPQFPRHTWSNSRLLQPSRSGSSLSENIDIELEVLENLQKCVGKLLQLDGAHWLFRMDNGADEDLITAISAMQRISLETETNDPCKSHVWEKYSWSHIRRGSNDLRPYQNGVPNCGKGCVWGGSLLISFGVWCVHRVLELSIMESRPELWGKYTYVLNRLQGILEPAFLKPRIVPAPCKCVSDPILLDGGKRGKSSRQGNSRDYSSGELGGSSIQSYPHPWSWGRNTTNAKGKGASASTFLDMIKEVEAAVGSRKGRTGTAAGDVAFPKGKENLASVLKRYKRRLANRPPGSSSVGSGGRRVSLGFPHALLFAALVSFL